MIEQDHMPAEVATALLTERKARLSNRMRKNCSSARELAVPSGYPIHRMRDEINGRPQYQYSLKQVSKTIDARVVKRMREATAKQLLLWVLRCSRRRSVAQKQYLKLDGKSKRDESARQLLEALVAKLDLIRDTIETELERRGTKCLS